MTWKDLAELISKLTPEQQEMDLSIHDPSNDEYYEVFALSDNDTGGVLDEKHPYLILKI